MYYDVGRDAALIRLGLLKIAVKVPFIHGTSGRWPVLRPGLGTSVLSADPNPRAVYTAMANVNPKNKRYRLIEQFAREAADVKGGTPVVAHGKMDTRKGWAPLRLNPWGVQNIGTVEDAREIVQQLDQIKDKRLRGPLWEKLQRGTSTWRNDDMTATLKPKKYKAVSE